VPVDQREDHFEASFVRNSEGATMPSAHLHRGPDATILEANLSAGSS
jgi:hypothetical protein